MKKILDLSAYPAEQIADSINSMWVGEYGQCKRKDFICGVDTILDYVLTRENVETSLVIGSIIEIYCGKKHKAEKVREMMKKKGFCSFNSHKSNNGYEVDDYIVYIGKLPSHCSTDYFLP